MNRRDFLRGAVAVAAVAAVPLPAPVNPTVKALLAGEVMPWSVGHITATEVLAKQRMLNMAWETIGQDLYPLIAINQDRTYELLRPPPAAVETAWKIVRGEIAL